MCTAAVQSLPSMPCVCTDRIPDQCLETDNIEELVFCIPSTFRCSLIKRFSDIHVINNIIYSCVCVNDGCGDDGEKVTTIADDITSASNFPASSFTTRPSL